MNVSLVFLHQQQEFEGLALPFQSSECMEFWLVLLCTATASFCFCDSLTQDPLVLQVCTHHKASPLWSSADLSSHNPATAATSYCEVYTIALPRGGACGVCKSALST